MKTAYDMFPNIDDHRNPSDFADIQDPQFWAIFEQCKPYSLLGVEGFYNLFRSIEYIAQNEIAGDIVECGVFLGGAILAMSMFASHFGLNNRCFYLYDTFSGFTVGTSDVDLRGETINFRQHPSYLPVVREVISHAPYPEDKFRFVPGPVEETLSITKPEHIALLRLDTDYFESTRVELEQLYPRLSPGGVLIVDDYGHFQGVRRATDEFFNRQSHSILLSRINYTIRCGIKPC